MSATDGMVPNYCHALSALCVMRRALLSHLKGGEYFYNGLTDTVFPVRYRDELEIISTEEKISRPDARPRLALNLGDFSVTPFHPRAVPSGNSINMITGAIELTISTPSEAMSEALRVECAFFLSSGWSNFAKIGLLIKEVRVSAVRQDRDGHPNFYITTLTIPVDFQLTMWKMPSFDSMLREISISAVDTLSGPL